MFTTIEFLESRRLLSGGDVDRSFGANGAIVGAATLPFESDFTNVSIVATFPTSRRQTLVVARGESPINAIDDTAFLSQVFIFRINDGGGIDSTFATGGFAQIMPRYGDYALPVSAKLDSRNRLIVAAAVGNDDPYETEYPFRSGEISIYRFTPAGKLDRSFSGDGKVALGVRGYDLTSAVHVDARDRISFAVAEAERDEYPYDQTVVGRLTDRGVFDRTFDQDGIKLVANLELMSSGMDDAGRLIISGTKSYENYETYRFVSNGGLDPTFGRAGVVTGIAASRLSPLAGGRLLVGREDYTSILNDNGTIDTAFGSDGRFRAETLGSPDVVGVRFLHEVIRNDGSISIGADKTEFEVDRTTPVLIRVSSKGRLIAERELIPLRYGVVLSGQSANGDLIFAGGSRVFFSSSTGNVFRQRTTTALINTNYDTQAIDATGRLIQGISGGGAFGGVAFMPNGRVDRNYGDIGIVQRGAAYQDDALTFGLPALLPRGDGSTLYVAEGTQSDRDALAALYFVADSSGVIDGRFSATDVNNPIASIETTGTTVHLSPNGEFSLLWKDYTYNSFNGVALAPSGQVIALTIGSVSDYNCYRGPYDSDRLVVIPGRAGYYLRRVFETEAVLDDPPAVFSPALLKYKSSGEVDPAFNSGHGILFDGIPLAAQSDESLLYTRSTATGLYRLSARGNADRAFGNNGVAAAGFENFDVDSTGRIIAWRVLRGGVADGDVQVMRLTKNGKRDTTFGGGDGLVTIDTKLSSAATPNLLVTPENKIVVTSYLQNHQTNTVRWSATRLLA